MLKAEGRNAAQKFWYYVGTLDRSEQAAQFIVDSNCNPTQGMKEALTGHLEALCGSRGCMRDLQLDEGDPLSVVKRGLNRVPQRKEP
ncbi:hypothetical protein MRX96_013406 [Rhipicephalus microplus]